MARSMIHPLWSRSSPGMAPQLALPTRIPRYDPSGEFNLLHYYPFSSLNPLPFIHAHYLLTYAYCNKDSLYNLNENRENEIISRGCKSCEL